mmetsp:Transcript_41098/g.107937  ORF Transcript_41098/g.107937 Transcript_41098/m.107937 type:complete len:285 (-) Transcript_41098:428-1282(-)
MNFREHTFVDHFQALLSFDLQGTSSIGHCGRCRHALPSHYTKSVVITVTKLPVFCLHHSFVANVNHARLDHRYGSFIVSVLHGFTKTFQQHSHRHIHQNDPGDVHVHHKEHGGRRSSGAEIQRPRDPRAPRIKHRQLAHGDHGPGKVAKIGMPQILHHSEHLHSHDCEDTHHEQQNQHTGEDSCRRLRHGRKQQAHSLHTTNQPQHPKRPQQTKHRDTTDVSTGEQAWNGDPDHHHVEDVALVGPEFEEPVTVEVYDQLQQEHDVEHNLECFEDRRSACPRRRE